jgi:hypothetical protein
MEVLNVKELRVLKNQLSNQLLDSSLTKEKFIEIRSQFYKVDYELWDLNKSKLLARQAQAAGTDLEGKNQMAA